MLYIKQNYTILVPAMSLKSLSTSQLRSSKHYYLLASTKTEVSCTGSLTKDTFPATGSSVRNLLTLSHCMALSIHDIANHTLPHTVHFSSRMWRTSGAHLKIHLGHIHAGYMHAEEQSYICGMHMCNVTSVGQWSVDSSVLLWQTQPPVLYKKDWQQC